MTFKKGNKINLGKKDNQKLKNKKSEIRKLWWKINRSNDKLMIKRSKKISKKLKGKPNWIKGLTKETDERVKKISDSLIGHKGAFLNKKRPEHSKIMSGRKQTDSHIKKRFAKKKNTSIELAIKNRLNLKNISFEKQKIICGFSVDFYIQKYNLIIECDGDYWHSLPKVKKRDIKKNKIFAFAKINLIRLQEYEIKNNIELCDIKIQEAIKNVC